MNNGLSDDELNKINKLKQKLYSRSLIENASRLNPLSKHQVKVPTDWTEETDTIKETAPKSAPLTDMSAKESVSDFLNKKFDNINTDSFSQERASRVESKIEQTNLALKVAEARLTTKSTGIYDNLKKPEPATATTEKPKIGLDSIESTFQPDYKPDLHTVKIGEGADQQDLKKAEKSKGKKSRFTFGFIIFMLIFFFFIGAGFYTYISLSQGTNIISTNKIDIKVTGPVSVKSGEVSDFIVDITNNNTTELILSDLVIQYPDGSKSPLDRNQDLTNERISVGTIKPGETVRQKNSVVFFGEQNAKKNVRYSYEFNINDSATIFKTDKDVGVFISGSPVTVTVTNVKEINNNQELTFDIDLRSNTEEVLKNIQLKVEYPFGYKLLEASPKPIADNDTWSFADLDSLSSTTIRLKGKFVGEVNVEKNFRFILGVEDAKTKEMLTVLSTQDNQVAIRRPFVITRLLIDGDNSDNKAVAYDDNLKSDLIITNNLKEPITDVVVELNLGGVLIDRGTVKSSDGFYDSNKDLILWDKSLNAGLTNIPPGESRELSFNISTIAADDSLIKTLRRAVSDLTVNVSAQRLGENRVPESVIASTKKQLRLQTDVVFSSRLSHDSGVFPPEVNKETVYTYTGSISNSANTLKGATFTAKLPPNAVWKGVSDIPASSIKYNSSTREVTISLGDVEAGVGITKAAQEFYFKVGFTPTLTQKGQYPILLMNPTLIATDSFTGQKIQNKTNNVSISIMSGTEGSPSGRVK